MASIKRITELEWMISPAQKHYLMGKSNDDYDQYQELLEKFVESSNDALRQMERLVNKKH